IDRFNHCETVEQNECCRAEDVVQRNWILIDIDAPRQNMKWSATDAEKNLAWDLLCDVLTYLDGQGLQVRLIDDSGNGYHALVPICLPTDEGGFVKRFLEHLAHRFNGDGSRGVIDTVVHDPSRIVKLPGTLSKKGSHIPEEGRVW